MGYGRGKHASKHEDGGNDEISVEDLSGEVADSQNPKSHASSHQNAGSDEVSVAGLSGELADNQNAKAHASSHEDEGADEIDLSGLSGQQIMVPYNGKIADINEADTNKHTLDLAAALSETRTIVAVLVISARVTGGSNFIVYPNEETFGLQLTGGLYGGTSIYGDDTWVLVASGTNRLQYNIEVANEDFDLYCFGYVVEA